MSTQQYEGGCHCGAVRFRVKAPEVLDVFKCDCSVCIMRQNHHFIVPEAWFQLLQGSEVLNEYRFNTKVARHMFCSVCGISSFYRPRSNPDGYAITIYCLDPEPKREVRWEEFHGQEWEATMASHETIKSKSKEPSA